MPKCFTTYYVDDNNKIQKGLDLVIDDGSKEVKFASRPMNQRRESLRDFDKTVRWERGDKATSSS